jgi:hypothetical protein
VEHAVEDHEQHADGTGAHQRQAPNCLFERRPVGGDAEGAEERANLEDHGLAEAEGEGQAEGADDHQLGEV